MTDAVYTHGHHESVLRSHRWRTAENSAAYLLGELRAGLDVLDVGCGPGTITADLAALVAPGGRVTAVDAAAGVLAQAREVSAERGLDNVDFAVADVNGLGFPTTRSTWCTPTRCSSTSATRWARCGRCAGCAPRRGRRRTGQRLRAAFTWFPEVRRWTPGGRCTGGWPGPAAGSRTRPPAAVVARPRASRTSPPEPPRGATPPRRSAPGGAGCGRTVRRGRRTRGWRWTAATRHRRSWRPSPRVAGVGAQPGRLVPGAARRTAVPGIGRTRPVRDLRYRRRTGPLGRRR